MRKLYSLVIALLLLAAVTSETVRAQYTMASYIVRKVDTPDPQGLGSGSNWQKVSGTALTSGYLQYYQGLDYYCSTPMQIPFNFRFVNQQITTTNTFAVGSSGSICLGPNVPSQYGMYGGYYNEDYCYFYGLNNSSNYWYGYDYGMYYTTGTDYELMPFSGYQYDYIPSESSNVASWTYAVLGTAPNREMVVESDNHHTYDDSYYNYGTYGAWQVVVYENGISHFQFNYGPTNVGTLPCFGSGATTISGFTWPGSWCYNYCYNYSSYGYLFDYASICGMKYAAGSSVYLDWNGNGWNQSAPFIYDYNNSFSYGTYKYGSSSYTHNVTTGGTWVGSSAYNNSGHASLSSTNTYTESNPYPFFCDTAKKLPQSSIGFFIAFPYDFTAGNIISPANEQPYPIATPLRDTVVVSNGGSSVPTQVLVNFTITQVNVGQVYNFTDTLTNVAKPANGPIPALPAIPAAFTSVNVPFPSYTPPGPTAGYGIYEDTMIIYGLLPTPDQNPSDNTNTNEWICSPPNDIKTVTILNPPTGAQGRTPIAVAAPVQMRFRNLGTNNQTMVPVTAVIKDPNGNVEYRDTVIIKNWPAGPFGGNSDGTTSYASSGQGPGKGAYYDTTFADWTPPELGNHTVCGIAILPNDQLRGDDTICSSVFVLPTYDAASTGIVNPQPDQEMPYGTSWQPGALFQSVGVSDLFDVPVRVQIHRCSDGVLVFQADSIMPELNIDQGQVRFYFPSFQGGAYNTANIAPGCYTICAIARYQLDGNSANDTACSQFTVIDRLKGNIYVGVGRRFQTIHAAVDSMRFRGIGGNLNLILTDANYTENGTYRVSSNNADLDFRGISGLSANSVVTWEPLPGVSPTITFTGNRPACMYFGDLFGGYMTFEGYNPPGVPVPDKVVAEPNKRGITFVDQRTVAGPVFDIEEGASNITMKDLIVHGNCTNGPGGNGFYADDSSACVRIWNQQNFTIYLSLVHDTVPINHIMVNNCELGQSKFGIRDDGLTDQFNLGKQSFYVWRNNTNKFTRNTIGTATAPLSFAGIEFNNEQDLTISHNEISNINPNFAGATGTNWNAFGILQPAVTQYQPGVGQPAPLVPADTGNVVRCWIDANRIKNITSFQGNTYGIAIQQAVTIYQQGSGASAKYSQPPILTQNRITNNMILDLYSVSGSYPILMNTAGSTYSTDGDSIFNNSITTNNGSANITVQYAKHAFLWNNIIQNTGAGPYVNYSLTLPRPYSAAISSDYNLFDLRNNNTFATVTEYDARYGTQFQVKTFRRLNDWQSLLHQDIHSITGDPLFAAPTDPLPNDSLHMPSALSYKESPAFANGIWLGTATQRYDFDGDQRLTGTLTPSIGADEWDGFQYTNDLAVQAITQPGGFSSTSDTTLITIENPLWITSEVKNLSSQSIFNRSVSAKLEVALSGGAYNTIWSTNTAPMTWNAGETKNVTFQGPTLTQKQVSTGVFRLTVSVPNDQLNSNNVKQKIFSVFLKTQAVLVCYNGASGAGSPGTNNRDAVVQALNNLGVNYDLMDRNAPDGLANTTTIDYTPWWTILWCSGDPTIAPVYGQPVGQGGLSFKETQELESYLKAGQGYAKKSLVVAGQNIAFYNGFVHPNNQPPAPAPAVIPVTDTEWLQGYMHTMFVATTPVSGTYNNYIVGQQPIFWKYPDSLSCASPDVVKPTFTTSLVGSEVTGFAYSYKTHPLTPNDSGAGVTYYNPMVNTIFFGFDWSSPVVTSPGGANYLTSGTTRVLSGALAFILSHNGTVLPVQFVSATGNRTGANTALLNWSVADQNNIATYNVEQKQTDGSWLHAGSTSVGTDNNYSLNVSGLDAPQSYTYHIVAIDKDGAKTYSDNIQIDPYTASADFSLGQNFPNPSNGMTDVQYTLPVASTVTMRVLDVTGKEVMTVMSNVQKDAGTQTESLDLSNLASGTYVYQLTAVGTDGQTVTLSKKLTLAKQ